MADGLVAGVEMLPIRQIIQVADMPDDWVLELILEAGGVTLGGFASTLVMVLVMIGTTDPTKAE